MLQVKCSVHNIMYILLYTRTVVVVADARNEVPGIDSTRYIGIYTNDDIREYT